MSSEVVIIMQIDLCVFFIMDLGSVNAFADKICAKSAKRKCERCVRFPGMIILKKALIDLAPKTVGGHGS